MNREYGLKVKTWGELFQFADLGLFIYQSLNTHEVLKCRKVCRGWWLVAQDALTTRALNVFQNMYKLDLRRMEPWMLVKKIMMLSRELQSMELQIMERNSYEDSRFSPYGDNGYRSSYYSPYIASPSIPTSTVPTSRVPTSITKTSPYFPKYEPTIPTPMTPANSPSRKYWDPPGYQQIYYPSRQPTEYVPKSLATTALSHVSQYMNANDCASTVEALANVKRLKTEPEERVRIEEIIEAGEKEAELVARQKRLQLTEEEEEQAVRSFIDITGVDDVTLARQAVVSSGGLQQALNKFFTVGG